MTTADDLYRTVVLDHGKRPRNLGRLAAPTHAADGDNPLCGDALHVEAAVDEARLVAARFEGESCLLATASASLMTELLVGRTVDAAERAIAMMEELCRTGAIDEREGGLEPLRAFADVHRHPVRVQCAMLPWRTLRQALAV